MAAISAFPSSLCCQISRASSSLPSTSPSFPSLRHLRGLSTSFSPLQWRRNPLRLRTPLDKPIRAVDGGAETLAPEEEAPPAEQPVSVPVSPSDVLTMFFKAEGSMDEAAIPRVSKALQEVEGISDLKVQVLEGIASVEVTKQTTVQATGVASNLVEIIQGSGFKLQTLNLSFEDEEDFVNS